MRSSSAPVLGQELPLSVDRARQFVVHGWEKRHPECTLVLQLPAPVAPEEVFLRLSDPARGAASLEAPDHQRHALLWTSSEGTGFAGSGAAHHIRLEGPGRPETLRRRAQDLFDHLQVETVEGFVAPTPRLFGGLAFESGGARESRWQAFGDGSFALPRWLYSRQGGQAFLSLASPPGEEISPALLDELERLLVGLAAADQRPVERSLPRALRIEPLPRQRWAEQVEAIRDAIGDGRFQKIVAARRARVEFAGPLDPIALLARLDGFNPRCRRFAFRRGESTFLGATPERLISRRGARIETEALAGSIGGDRQQAATLLASTKDQGEHALVVQHIVERLQPLCTALEWSPEPRIRELRNLLHLHTPIRGTLSSSSHILELVDRIHPTPAVGGVPAKEAVRWIAEHEACPRGWYAGPIGWFDANGDGEFDVALRSCLLSGNEALLYVGAGIMLDSDPDLEYQETDLKQTSLLAALGVGE
ncbi:MAG: isochorismate synthase [Deltaproteobacteria bacterium]|nr:isochorismate synthase [Deltaproteobacteria bacterium]